MNFASEQRVTRSLYRKCLHFYRNSNECKIPKNTEEVNLTARKPGGREDSSGADANQVTAIVLDTKTFPQCTRCPDQQVSFIELNGSNKGKQGVGF